MLAQLGEEKHAPDRAAQGTGEGAKGDYQDRCLGSTLEVRLMYYRSYCNIGMELARRKPPGVLQNDVLR